MKSRISLEKSPVGIFAARGGLALLVAVVLLMALATVVLAIPQLGHYFYGNAVTDHGILLPAGTIVMAKAAGGAWTGSVSTTVDLAGRYGYMPTLGIPADDPATATIEGASPGDPIEFYIMGVKARLYDVAAGTWRDSYPFEIGGLTNLNLSAAIYYTITASAGANGRIAPSGQVTVGYGLSQTFTITPNTSYRIADVLVDGVSVGAVSSYTFSNVTANHTISASFALQSFVITPTAGAGGTITPGTPQTVSYGGSITFTITPNVGYRIADVLVDGVSVGAVSSYTFSNVTANHTISARFASTAITFAVPLSAGWNLFSTPVALAVSSNTLPAIFAQSVSNIEIAYRWDAIQGQWIALDANFALLPLEAIAVKVKAGTAITGTLVPSQELNGPPSRSLPVGLSLIGPAPAFDGSGFPAMSVVEALRSIEQAPGGLPGYSMVISPAMNQPGWTYVRDGTPQNLLAYKGYWVVMENPDTLYGFSTTPIVP